MTMKRLPIRLLTMAILLLTTQVAQAQWPQFVQDAHDEAANEYQAALFLGVEIVPPAQRDADDAGEAAAAQRLLCTDQDALDAGDAKAQEGADSYADGTENKTDAAGWVGDAFTLHQAALVKAGVADWAGAVELWQQSKATSILAQDAYALAETQFNAGAQDWCEAEAIFWEGSPGNGPGGGPAP